MNNKESIDVDRIEQRKIVEEVKISKLTVTYKL